MSDEDDFRRQYGAIEAHYRAASLLAWGGARTEQQREHAYGSPAQARVIALILNGDTLERLPDEHADRCKILVPRCATRASPFAELTRAQRRRRARSFSGPGRRRACPVPIGEPPELKIVREVDTYVAHGLSDGRRYVRLFLPEGQIVTDEHCRNVERWLRDNTGTR